MRSHCFKERHPVGLDGVGEVRRCGQEEEVEVGGEYEAALGSHQLTVHQVSRLHWEAA